MKPILIILGFLLAAAGIAFWLEARQKAFLASVDTYEKCASAGFPVELSYPGRCRTPDGRVFTQELPSTPFEE